MIRKFDVLVSLFWVTLIIVLIGVGINGNKRVNIVNEGCCQVGTARCASGVGVDEVVCDIELSGTWVPNKICNVDSGKCE